MNPDLQRPVIPAKAGIQMQRLNMDPRLRGDDNGRGAPGCKADRDGYAGVRRIRKQSSGLFSRRTPEQTCEGREGGRGQICFGQI